MKKALLGQDIPAVATLRNRPSHVGQNSPLFHNSNMKFPNFDLIGVKRSGIPQQL